MPNEETRPVAAETSDPTLSAEEIVKAYGKDLRRGNWNTRRPASTYRIQLSPAFGFADAAGVIPYLASLGVDAVYLSPILAATPGSTHGYDVVDHNRLNPELGGDEGYAVLVKALAQAGMGQIVDFVPNHMGIGPWNRLWMDLLENGPSSTYSAFFDVDWNPRKDELHNKLLVPVLGDQYGVVLDRGELVLSREGGAFVLKYYDHRFPIAPRTVPMILRKGIERLADEIGRDSEGYQELESICTALDKLAPRDETSSEAIAERSREKEVAKRRLASLCEKSDSIRAFIDGNVALFNGRVDDPRSFDPLHALLEVQAYRLAYWRVAGEEINYRRFFDINSLAAIRMEEPVVFAETHKLLLGLMAKEQITGLRIDHPDGLYNPAGYFRHLQAAFASERIRASAAEKGLRVADDLFQEVVELVAQQMEADRVPRKPLFVVAEKILARGEQMPDGWAVDGSTGYDFMNAVNGLFIDPSHEMAFDRLYSRHRGGRSLYHYEARAAKKLVASSLMVSELNMLAQSLNRISETNRRTRDFTLNDLTAVIAEFVAEFPVYRTYITPASQVDARDVAYVDAAIARARQKQPMFDPSIFEFLRDVILLKWPKGLSVAEQRSWLEFTLKLQQVTGPITAKALEDTAFYVYLRLVSLNEVGGDPDQFGVSTQAFHVQNMQRRSNWPGSLLATSTHDSKRGEDVRLRIDALSEIPDEWSEKLRAWTRLLRRFATRLGAAYAPEKNEEILFYQTLVGTMPDEVGPGTPGWDQYVARIWAYMQKAMREAKKNTSWISVDEKYEAAVRSFVETALNTTAFLDAIAPFSRRISNAAHISSLAQVAIKCASPGVADIYQGCELWDLSLVDPDNRRAVEFGLRERYLNEVDHVSEKGPTSRAELARELVSPEAIRDGRAKLFLLAAGLRLRRSDPQLFLEGEYIPLEVEGPHANHVVAFARRAGNNSVLCVAPRLVLQLLDKGEPIVWQGCVRLPTGLPRNFLNAVTGQEVIGGTLDLSQCFEGFPVALLTSEGPPQSALRRLVFRWTGK